MTPIPLSPPTDNLYKFATVAGIILVVVFVALLWGSERSYVESRRDLEEKMLLDTVRAERLRNRFGEELIKVLEASADSLAGRSHRARKGTTESSGLSEQSESATNQRTDSPLVVLRAHTPVRISSSDILPQFDSLLAEYRAEFIIKRARMAELENGHRRDRVFFGTGVVVGLIVAVLGLIAWFFRFQRFQDELLVLQVAEARTRAAVPENSDVKP